MPGTTPPDPPSPYGIGTCVLAILHRVTVWLGGQEPAVLASLLLILIAAFAFIRIADEVTEGDTMHFDPWVLRALRTPEHPEIPIGPPWLAQVARDTTALGGYGCLIFFTLTTAGYLWLDEKRHLSMFLLASATSGYLVSSLLKLMFQRPRPDIVPHLDRVISTSFPSGHSMNAAVIYLTLGTLIAASVARKRVKVYVLSMAAVLTVLVGLSRVYLGVHYPSDVAAGWMAGLVWALICSLTARFLQLRGKVEQPEPPAPSDIRVLEPHDSV